MPYSFLHVAAMRNDVEKAEQLINGEAPDDVHVWKSMPLEMQNRNLDPVFVDGGQLLPARSAPAQQWRALTREV